MGRYYKKTWTETHIPDMYEYAGHTEASIMYNTDVLNVGTPSSDYIDKTVRCLQRKSNTRLGKTLPLNFLPIPRMTIRKVKTKDDSFECIFVSWHGPNSGEWKSDLKKIEYFEYFMEFMRVLQEKNNWSIIIGGDFNIQLAKIKATVTSPFKIHEYRPSKRRRNLIDYIITTTDLQLVKLRRIDMDKDTEAKNPKAVLNHDPFIATIRLEKRTDTVETKLHSSSRTVSSRSYEWPAVRFE